MPNAKRAVRVPAFAKINLGLRVLHKRPDGYHELRTVFQTISLCDRLAIEYRPAAATRIHLDCEIEIPNNLVLRAAEAVLDEMKVQAEVRFRLAKQIPMGGGLGGGSTDAAAVLLALPALAGKPISRERLLALAAGLGSDVPFFLMGGTALGLGRGEELYPLPEPGTTWGLLLCPGLHVATPWAFGALGRELTTSPNSHTINSFQSGGWEIREGLPVSAFRAWCCNDFEEVVFSRHPKLKRLKKKLERAGAVLAAMTGSGSALFGLFASRTAARNAAGLFPRTKTVLFQLVDRARYRAEWYRSLKSHALDDQWPPLSRYVE